MENRSSTSKFFSEKNEKEENKTPEQEIKSEEEIKDSVVMLNKAIEGYQDSLNEKKSYALALKKMVEEHAAKVISEKLNEITSYTNRDKGNTKEELELLEKLTDEVEALFDIISTANKELSKNPNPLYILRPELKDCELNYNGHLNLNFSYWTIKNCTFNFDSIDNTEWNEADLENVTFGEDSTYSLYALAVSSYENLTFETIKGHDFLAGETELTSREQNELLDTYYEERAAKLGSAKLSQENDRLSKEVAELTAKLAESERKRKPENESEKEVEAKKQKKDDEHPQSRPTSPRPF